VLSDMIGDPDPEKANRAMQAMLQMVKFDIAALEAAYEGAKEPARS
jgi:predicted 3-demethylubiquinone-9 3-methyltransferase (glyoxalase superfamily)